MQPIRVAFGHQARTGKDTACSWLTETYGGKTLRFAAGVYDVAGLIQCYFGKPIEKDPPLLQMIGLGIRTVYGANVWADVVECIVEENPTSNLYVSDVRFPNEADMLRRHGFKIVKVTRKDRPIDRDPNHPSETALDDYDFDIVITNNSTIKEFIAKVDKYVSA